MDGWYIRREEQQNGPYTLQQLCELDAGQQLFDNDLFYDPNTGVWLTLAQARQVWYTVPPAQKAPKKRKKRRGCLITLLVIVLAAAGVITFSLLNKTSDNMILGKRQQAVRQAVETSGGAVVVQNPDSPVNGMKIEVPAGAYEKKTNFKISTREIKNHRFGERFNPLTPLITVDNGHGFAGETMTVTIPITLPADSFAMAFYYDEKTGKLEGLPLVSLSDTQLVVAANHFSDIVAASVKKSDLQNQTIETGFAPGLDDWHFVNRGSWIAQGGHCAGQTVSAMWYYFERYLSNGERRLYGLFDNNRYGVNTKSFWQDDSWAYRFASVTQYSLDWDSKMRTITTAMGGLGDHYTLYAFQFSMMMTGEPQYISISKTYTDSEGKDHRLGHAIIAYRIEGNKIYTADPNYPGVSKVMTYENSGFKPYSSGLNADDISANGAIGFDTIRYIAKSAMIDWGKMGELYRQTLEGTIGNGLFPDLTYEVATHYDPATGTYTWAKCPEQIETDPDTTAKVDESLRGKIVIKAESGYSNQYNTGYLGLSPVSVASPKSQAPNGYMIYTLPLKKGENHLGILTEFRNDKGKDKYADYKRIKIVYDQQALLEFEQDEYDAMAFLESEYKAIATDAPGDTEYVWNFGDGTGEVKTEKPIGKHIYQAEGDYGITLKAVSKKDGTLYAETMTTVTVFNLAGTWKLDYTIEEAGVVDNIINWIVKGIVSIINTIFETDANPDDVNVTIEGTVIGCEMTVTPSSDGKNPFRVVLQQLTSSTDYVDPSSELWTGELTVLDGQVSIQFAATNEDGSSAGVLRFEGVMTSSGSMDGSFDMVLMSGSFAASK